MKSRSIYLPIAFALVLAAGLLLGRLLPGVEQYDKLEEVIGHVKFNYVDAVDPDELKENAIQTMLMELDPHSAYIPASNLRDVNDQLHGAFFGIGVQFRLRKDSILVIRTIPNGPSEKSGLLAGDRIVKVDGELVAGVGITNPEVLDRLKGMQGTQVNVEVFRRGMKDLVPINITRGIIPNKSVDIAYMADPVTGYIKVSRFSDRTYHEFAGALTDLLREGMKKLIIDLRGNSGGYLSAAVAIADELLPRGTMIVYTEGLHRGKTEFRAERRGMFEEGELIILIDDMSASASEILAGALQDNDRGTIIGRRSFGKGLVQEQIDLRDSSAMRLTVARYYTPTGRSIQKPYSEGHAAYYGDIVDRYSNGEMLHPDSIHFDDSLKFTTPGGKTVYGGGGIMPDLYITVDSSAYAPFYYMLNSSGILYDFAVDYIDAHRRELEGYGSAKGFVSGFKVDDKIYQELLNYASELGITLSRDVNPESSLLIRNRLKAFIGRDVFDDAAFYPVFLLEDKTFQRAMEL